MQAAALGLEWIEIPTYQRGISWTLENVLELIGSDSVLMGNVLMGQFPVPKGQLPLLPPGIAQYSILVDGLQRLAVGTAILAILAPTVLSPTPSNPYAALFGAFQTALASRLAIALHNDVEFRHHPRQVLRDQYIALHDALKDHIDDQLATPTAAQSLATDLERTFIHKQIAVDLYFNFPSKSALMSTFLGINTIRVDLGPVDLVRAHIIDKGEHSGWTPSTIESVENSFGDVFVDGERPDRELLPFVNSTYKFLGDQPPGSPLSPTDIFPSWVGLLTQQEVDHFIDFARQFKLPAGNGYVREIRAAGTLPFSVLLAYYYRQTVNGAQIPSFLSGGMEDDADLYQFLKAIYRTVLAGKIGRLTPIVDKCLRASYSTLGAVADDIASTFAEVPLSQPVDKAWLLERLSGLKKPTSPRVFNAMLLPTAPQSGAFEPLQYGLANDQFQIDHLIPEAALQANQPGRQDGQTLRNFAPLPRPSNHTAKNTPCSQKLAAGGIYDQWLTGVSGVHPAHPYGQWLTSTQAQYGTQLDNQATLERNATPAIGDERIAYIAETLVPLV